MRNNRFRAVHNVASALACSAVYALGLELRGEILTSGGLLMFRVKESMHVNAPIDRCFLLSTSVPLVEKILGMKPVAGNTTGMVQMGDRVLWRGRKFGLRVQHETLITAYDRPRFFQDSMARGQFKHFHHDHRLEEVAGQTLFVDVVKFSLPFGVLGRIVGRWIVVPHVVALLRSRYKMLKQIAESDEWRQYIPPSGAAVDQAFGDGIADANPAPLERIQNVMR